MASKDVIFKVILGFQSFGGIKKVASKSQNNPATQAPPSLAVAGSKQEANFKAQSPRNETSLFQLFTKLQIFQLKIKKIA